jgi:hypothetical protein
MYTRSPTLNAALGLLDPHKLRLAYHTSMWWPCHMPVWTVTHVFHLHNFAAVGFVRLGVTVRDKGLRTTGEWMLTACLTQGGKFRAQDIPFEICHGCIRGTVEVWSPFHSI